MCRSGSLGGRTALQYPSDGFLAQGEECPAWVDYWVHDVDHDWAWWRKQIVYFMQHLLTDSEVDYVI